MRPELLITIFKRSPEEALDETFKRYRKFVSYGPEVAHFWCSMAGVPPDRNTYGSYKMVYRKDLKDRKYRLGFWDGAVTIFFLDVQLDTSFGLKTAPAQDTIPT